MFNWLRKLFGSDISDIPVIAQVPVVEEQAETVAKPKTQAKKPAAKPKTKKASVDLDNMSKKELLAHAKANGIKANASLKKDELLERIKAG